MPAPPPPDRGPAGAAPPARRAPGTTPGLDRLGAGEELGIVGLPGVAPAVADQDVAGVVGAVDAAAGAGHVVDQRRVDMAAHRPPAAGALQRCARDQHRAAGDRARPALAPHAALPDGPVRARQVDRRGELADQRRPGILVRQHQVPEMLGAVDVVVVHLRQQRSGGRGRGRVQHRAEGLLRADAQHRRRMREAGAGAGHRGLPEARAVQRQDQLEMRVALPRDIGHRRRQPPGAPGREQHRHQG